MCTLANFLKNYDTIIFDMDGVITQEQNYWTAAALTVWEFLYSKNYYGSFILDAPTLFENCRDIRSKIFLDDELITLLKGKGVNSNWDLAYITFATIMINDGDLSKSLLTAQSYNNNILWEYPIIAKKLSEKINIDCKRNGELWKNMQSCFQEWFLGDKIFLKKYNKKPILSGKSGLCYKELPLIDPKKLVEIFKALSSKGTRLCIATGRLLDEALIPLSNFGIYDYIDKNHIITYDFVVNAEKKFSTNLTKPHPYMFLKAMLGADYPDDKLLSGDFDKEKPKKTLGVGDAGADILSTHGSGMDFCAVLTGVSGKAAKSYFEEEKAEYILDSLENFLN